MLWLALRWDTTHAVLEEVDGFNSNGTSLARRIRVIAHGNSKKNVKPAVWKASH